MVTVTARADSGYAFTGWIGAGNGSYTGTDNPATVKMIGPVRQIAQFALIPCEDADGDGYGTSPAASCVSSTEADCDDANRSVYPGAPQLCDGINNDCTDQNWPAVPTSELDADGDGITVCGGDCDEAGASCSADSSAGPPPPPTDLTIQ
jgi:hypothetical protein